MVAVLAVSELRGPDRSRGETWGTDPVVPKPVNPAGNRTILVKAEWRSQWTKQ